MTAVQEDGAVHFFTIDGKELLADNIDTITIERVPSDKHSEPSEPDSFRVTYAADGKSLGPVWVSVYIYSSLKDLKKRRLEELNRLADAHE